jgi:hypothetical protein
MDLISCIKLVEDDFSFCSEMGIPCLFEGQAIRANYKKHRTFWHIVIHKLGRAIKNDIKAMLRVFVGTHFFELLVEMFSWVIDGSTTPDTDLCKIEASRDPPLVFIPLPKTESNGCARSDLPIRSLIFSERIPM